MLVLKLPWIPRRVGVAGKDYPQGTSFFSASASLFRRNLGMESRRRSRRSGQVLLMVTMALVPMFAILGLVTDVGYMQYVKMSAQTAAEAAARAAIISYHETVGGSNPVCGTGTGTVPGSAASPTTCASNITTPANFIEPGCTYAPSHEFNSTHQSLTYDPYA